MTSLAVDEVTGWAGPRAGFPAGEDLLFCVNEMRPRALRGMAQFAEEEIVIPDGEYKDFRYLCSRQPYSRLYFDAVDSGRYREFIAVGPTQSGKTLTCFVIPAMYHLFEIGETVICVVPDETMVADKWSLDILPVIKASRYASLLPTRGQGSRGGVVKDSVTFQNGCTLKFMTAGGGDTARAAFTSRVVIITEMNKFAQQKESSEEADMYRQVKGRMRSFGERGRLYGECTVTTEHGLVWSEYTNGTCSRIAIPCGHCETYVTPDREHLIGWDEASNVMEAENLSRWVCPACAVIWDDSERREYVRHGVLLHGAQEVEATEAGPVITGEHPATWTFGMRWSAVDNLFLNTGFIGGGEWTAKNLAEDEADAEREQLQFVWAKPVLDTAERSIVLRSDVLSRRQGKFGRGVVPPGAGLVAFLDLGKTKCHWVAMAGVRYRDGTMKYWIVDADIILTEVDHVGEEIGMPLAMREFHDRCEEGFIDANTGEVWSPALRIIDSGGKWADMVYQFVRDMSAQGHSGYFPSKGHGGAQDLAKIYTEPNIRTDRTPFIGDQYHVTVQEARGVYLLHVDVDAWKTKVHAALQTPEDSPGSLVLYKNDWKQMMGLARHLLSEVSIEEFKPGKGIVIHWEKKHKDNHWFDGTVGCFVGLDYLGAIYAESPKGEAAPEPVQEFQGPEGRLLGDVAFGGLLSQDR